MSDPKPPPPTVEPETFESTPSTSDPTFKYYEIAIPNFSFNQTGDQTGVTRTVANVSGDPTAGSSFVRLGSFPDVTQPGKGPAGFNKSLELAKLVGDASGISGAEGQDSSPSPYGGDPNYLLGFANDTRAQKAALTPPQGKPESIVLLTKGGWWDHSDGNRISTTAGDKVEIIQGNYKQVVMSRQQTPAGMLIHDVSGGMVQEQSPAPNCAIKTIEWTQVEGGEWTLYQNNGTGNVISSFYGQSGDLYFGPLKESWTGNKPPGFPETPFWTNCQNQRSAEGAATDPKEPTVVRDYTFAQTITSYTGYETQPVSTIEEWTFADTITTYNGTAAKPIGTTTETTWVGSTTSTTNVSGTVTETTTVDGTVTETTTVGGAVTGTTTVGGALTETTTVGAAKTEITTVAGALTSVTTAGMITEVTTAALETNIALNAAHVDVTLSALTAELFVGALRGEINAVGGRLTVNLGPALEINLPSAKVIDVPDRLEQRLSQIESDLEYLHRSLSSTQVCIAANILANRILLGP
jgi:hypothetical protein